MGLSLLSLGSLGINRGPFAYVLKAMAADTTCIGNPDLTKYGSFRELSEELTKRQAISNGS
jgi:hypothetical protein